MVMRKDELQPAHGSGDSSGHGSGASSRRHLGGGAIATIVGVVLLVVFVAQNSQDVKFDFLFWGVQIPIWLLSLLMAGVGALIAYGVGVVRRHRRRQARRD